MMTFRGRSGNPAWGFERMGCLMRIHGEHSGISCESSSAVDSGSAILNLRHMDKTIANARLILN